MTKISHIILAIAFVNAIAFANLNNFTDKQGIINTVRHFKEVNDFFDAFKKAKRNIIYDLDDNNQMTSLHDPRPRIVLYAKENQSNPETYIIDVIEDRYLENRVITFRTYYFDLKKNILYKYDEVTGKKIIINMNLSNKIKSILPIKQPLYSSPGELTKLHLIRGDYVYIVDEKDGWYSIIYHSKTKDIKAWIPKDAVDLNASH